MGYTMQEADAAHARAQVARNYSQSAASKCRVLCDAANELVRCSKDARNRLTGASTPAPPSTPREGPTGRTVTPEHAPRDATGPARGHPAP